ncbi:MAG: type II secretion system F family protein [Syntrophobacterales bacterium]|jgi:tight adherence protein B
MNVLIIGLLIFAVLVLIVESTLYAFRTFKNPNRDKIHKRLKTLSSTAQEAELPDIVRKRILSEVPFLHRLLSCLPPARSLDRLLEKANIGYPLGFFILLTLVLASSGFLATSVVSSKAAVSLAAAALCGAAPFFLVVLKKKRRMNELERQLPDALEMIARGLRAGHAFSTSIKFAADEFDDPLGTEFAKTIDEVNFGVSVTDALKNLADRVDCPDVQYFVVSVIIQREAGGNLAEVMDKIAHIIRERFKFRGKVKVLSAEGKLTALVLTGLPFVIVVVLMFTRPDYIRMLWVEPTGRIVTVLAALMMAAGILIIRRMIHIKL